MSNFEPLDLHSASYLTHLLRGVRLRDYQVRAAIHVALCDSQLLAFDVGLGKTMSVVAGLEAKRNNNGYIRALFLCPLKGLHQVKETFLKHATLSVEHLTGSTLSIRRFYGKASNSIEVLLVNYEAFDNPEVLKIIKHLVQSNYFDTIVCDEAHNFANIYTSNRNFFIAQTILKIPNRYFLTATPLISRMSQYATLVALMYGRLDELGSFVNRVKQGEFQHDLAPNLVQFRQRKDNYKVELHLFKKIKISRPAYGTEVFKYTRGKNALDVEDRLVNIIKANEGKLLIYSHLKANHQYLYDLATSLGRKAGIISGDTTVKETQDAFNAGDLDCVIFSIPTELNLPADEIILYDWTSMAHQAIGRGIRSEEVGNYTAHFFVTETEKEITLFENTVIKNSRYLRDAFGKEIEPLLNLAKSKVFN